MTRFSFPLILLVWASWMGSAAGVDWPMWRADPGHTAVTQEKLPTDLHWQWTLEFSPRKRVWDDPLNHDLMQYDKLLEPIVLGDLVFVGFSEKDKLSAFSLATGEEQWAFYADGPIRFAPVGWKDHVYVCSDDGYLYCLQAADGALVWKFRGAPDDRKALGNERVISAWPARGGPVIRDGTLYFAASIWPFMGTFIYALDARTGAVEWVNDGTGADYIKQPHSAPSFAGVAPQGTLVALEDHLLVPGGRSVPAAFDRKTGALLHFHLDDGGKANGGSFVIGRGDRFYVHTRLRGVRAYETKSGKKGGFVVNEPVLAPDMLYTAAAEPDLKVRLLAAEKAMKDAESEWAKAEKKLEDALGEKAKPLDEPLAALDEARSKREAAQRTLEELETQLDKEDASVKAAAGALEAATKAEEEAQKKLDEARKKKSDPIDKKLYEELEKRERELCDKELAYGGLRGQWTARGRDVRVLQGYNAKDELVWEFEADGLGDLIMAGDHLYAAGKDEIVAVAHPGDSARASVTWRHSVDGEVLRLLAANGKLIAVTLDGRILCFGEQKVDNPRRPRREVVASPEWPFSQAQDNKLARQVLALADVQEGYAMAVGVDDGRFLEALAEESELHCVAIDPDADTVAGLREKFDYMGLYGERIVLQQGEPQSYQAPPYIFSLVVLGADEAARLHDPSTMELLYESVRPYGGALWFPSNPGLAERYASLNLPGAEITAGPAGSTFVFRQGPLPEAADWTHQYGDMANTVKSDDKRVKLPLGILWFGGSPNTDVLPRHGHGPSEQVIGGRTIIQGMNRLSARDVYTGRILWKRDFENLGTYGIYYDHTYTDDPLNPAYNQVHIPGANARGTNYVATEDSIYVAIGSACHVLDSATGQDVKIIEMPPRSQEEPHPLWGFIGVEGDLLLAGNDFARYTSRYSLDEKDKDKDKESARGERRGRKRKNEDEKKADAVPPIEDMSASRGLIAFDRHSGDVLWKVEAEFSFLHNGIISGGGHIYLLDKFPKSMEEKLKRRGLAKPEDYRILAIDANTGVPVWEQRGDIFGTWLSYSAKHDILLEAGAKGRDRLKDEVGEGLTTYQGQTGDVLWKKEKLAYAGPCILHNDIILTAPDQYADSAGAYHLVDGSPYMVTNPLTGKSEPWRITRAYGCNNPIAGEHLLTFRSGAAGYYDLDNLSGTGNFGGFKSGCTSNLIPANGVLNAPDYTRTCSCGYQNQTSLALVHMPDVELWTYNRYGVDADTHEEIKRVGINFGAPGDRRADDGTLWLEHPDVGGHSPEVQVEVSAIEGKKLEYFRRHSSQVSTTHSLPWVAASGVRRASKITIIPQMRFQPKFSKDRLDIAVAGAAGDAEESAKGEVKLDSSDLELGRDETDQVVGLRFEDVQVFPGEKIKKAYLEFTVDEPAEEEIKDGEGQPIASAINILLENTSDAKPFQAEPRHLSSRSARAVDVVREWKPKLWKKEGDHGGDQQSADLAELMQEVVDRGDWQFGNAMAFYLRGAGRRVAHAFDADPAKAPKLVVELEGPQPRTRVAAKEDDAEERADGSVAVDSGDLELTRDAKISGEQVVGVRFRDLQIPRGQRIASAYIQFTTDEPSSAPTELSITTETSPVEYKGEDLNLTAREVVSPSVSWAPPAWEKKGEAGVAQRTPDLAALIQPLSESEDWEPGDALGFRFAGRGDRVAVSFDGKKEEAAKLMIHYVRSGVEQPLEEDAPQFTVQLHFSDPDKWPVGKRLCDVYLQGQRVLEAFDPASHRGTGEDVVVRAFTGVTISKALEIDLVCEPGGEPPVISGIELILEEPTASLSEEPAGDS